MAFEMNAFLRSIPPMDELLSLCWVSQFEAELGRESVKALFDEVLTEVRADAREGKVVEGASARDMVIKRARLLIERRAATSLRSLVNATGVVVHTNLGRSPLPQKVVAAVSSIAAGYSTLEYSLSSGGRGQRNVHVEWLLRRVTGAEAALVVNNNAGAVLLALTALAAGKEVIVSHGELVEIGGSFRIPDILAFSGAKMLAVGCTNCTHLRDYRARITENTAVILKVHPSNYRVMGFSKSVPRDELAELAKSHGLIFMEDLGSGLLEQPGTAGLDTEPTVLDCIRAGVDVVTFSGDKMLGGPQIGCVAGLKTLIDRMLDHQLLRALRVDKMTLAAFETILRMYLRGESEKIPTVAMLRVSPEILRERAHRLEAEIRGTLDSLSVRSIEVDLVETDDAVGGGAFPVESLPGWGVSLRSTAGIRAEKIAERLREVRRPIVTGVRDDRVVFHLRTLLPGEVPHVAEALREVFGRGGDNA